ncbi:MAG TPA: hypothetical protein VFE42_30050 [Chloroflexota bacterium]|nr:hypothetical protein [Chloroflexota bacterium]
MFRRSSVVVAIAATGLLMPGLQPVAARTGATSLTGTWQVKRTCVAFCTGTKVSREKVTAKGNNIYAASGDIDLMLYVLGKQVLVHDPDETSLLSVAPSGRQMSGSGVGGDGSTFTVVWRRAGG